MEDIPDSKKLTYTSEEGITISVGNYVEKMEQDKQAKEALKKFNEESTGHIRDLPKRGVKVRYKERPGRRVTRTKIFSGKEIKNMNEVHNSSALIPKLMRFFNENQHKNYIMSDLADAIGKDQKSTSAALSVLYRGLSALGYLTRTKDEKSRFVYVFDSRGVNLEEIYQEYKDFIKGNKKKKKELFTQAEESIQLSPIQIIGFKGLLIRLIEEGITVRFEIIFKGFK
jgi:hypothetical protein